MSESWIRETMELIEDWQKEKAVLEVELEETRNEIGELKNKITTGEALIQAYRSKHNVLPVPLQNIHHGYFGNKSYPEILKEIASKSGGYFKVLDATEIMLQAGVRDDKRAIQANIYGVLRRMKDHFVKVRRGEYRYTNSIPKPNEVVPTKEHTRSRSGVQAVIKNLKDNNPQMTKKEVLNLLLKTGFDFKGKRPANAVNIVWAKLGYSKEGKQQVLQIQVPESLTQKILGK